MDRTALDHKHEPGSSRWHQAPFQTSMTTSWTPLAAQLWCACCDRCCVWLAFGFASHTHTDTPQCKRQRSLEATVGIHLPLVCHHMQGNPVGPFCGTAAPCSPELHLPTLQELLPELSSEEDLACLQPPAQNPTASSSAGDITDHEFVTASSTDRSEVQFLVHSFTKRQLQQ